MIFVEFIVMACVAIVVFYCIIQLVKMADKNSIDGWTSSCTGDCQQGRKCNCVEKKE